VSAGRAAMPRLALFDLDHTRLSGDSDALWCEFLMDEGVLDRASCEARNADMARRYGAGSITPPRTRACYLMRLRRGGVC
jgi:phosphoserine phosphatase